MGASQIYRGDARGKCKLGPTSISETYVHLVASIIRVYSNSCIPQHGLRTCSSHNDLLIRSINRIRERRDHTELKFLLRLVSGDVEQSASIELLLVHLEIGERCVELDAPVDESVGTIEDTVFV